MHHDIDLAHCAQLLKQITYGIAAAGPRHAIDASVPDLIGQVQGVSAAADQLMRAELLARYPQIGWRDEDSASFDAAAPHWVYDPVDGAYHYLQGLPLWAASLALVQDGRAVLAMIYDPALDELFIATEGGGATLSGQPLRVSPKTDLALSVVGSAIAPALQVGAAAQADALRLLAAIAPQIFVIRPMAATSLQLAYVAAGRLDAYWEAGNDAADWLGGALLVREAGGVVSAWTAVRCGRAAAASSPATINLPCSCARPRRRPYRCPRADRRADLSIFFDSASSVRPLITEAAAAYHDRTGAGAATSVPPSPFDKGV